DLVTGVQTCALPIYVDEYRRRARRPQEAPYVAELDDRLAPSAEAAALAADGLGQLSEALDQLNDEQRSVITLRVLGDLSLEQTRSEERRVGKAGDER